MAVTKDLIILQGKTFALPLRYESTPVVYKPITGITQSAPVSITAPAHGIPNGWRVAVVSVKGMTEINAEANAVKDKDYHIATVVNANTVELNDVNSTDFKTYVSGGYLQFNTPVDLAGATARMSVKDKVGGTELLSLTTENGGITIDNTAKTITLNVTAVASAALTWTKGVYDLELIGTGGTVTALLTGKVAVTKEVTT